MAAARKWRRVGLNNGGLPWPIRRFSTESTEPLGADAELGQVIAAVNGLIARLDQRERVSPSVPLEAPHPSASIVYGDEEYDALSERPEAPAAAPSERLKRTMSSRPSRSW